MKKSLITAILLIVIASIFRIVNEEMNIWLNLGIFGAVALFSGAVIKNRALAILIPLITYLLTDTYLYLFSDVQGFYGISQVFTYISMVLVVLLGSKMKSIKPLSVIGFSISGSMIFWIVSNFGVWFGNLFTNYEPGLTLGFTYFRALPFYNHFAQELFIGTFVGDIISSTVIFGVYAFLQKSARTAFTLR